MILTLVDAAESIAALNIVDREHIYCGHMADKIECCVGVYHLERNGKSTTVGGRSNSSYCVKPVSILVHWNRSCKDTETAASRLYDALDSIRNVVVNGRHILFTDMRTYAPADVGTDDNGIYEMVIETDFYYKREE